MLQFIIPAIPAILTTGRALFLVGSIAAAALTQTKKGKEITSTLTEGFSNSMDRLNKNQANNRQMVKDIRSGKMK